MSDEKTYPPRSPFIGAWPNMFGWGRDATTDLLEVVTYDTSPSALSQMIALSPPLLKIVSEYCDDKKMIFEIWKYQDGANHYLNWYGPLTYGTCWFRGCKVWLAPSAGLAMNVDGVHAEEIKCQKNILRTAAVRAWRNCLTASEKYDTTLPYFRSDTPCDILKNIDTIPLVQNSQPNLVDFSIDDDEYQRGAHREFTGCLLQAFARAQWPNSYVAIKHSSFGGKEDPDVFIVFDQPAVLKELAWVQDVGAANHNIEFAWV